MPSAPKPLTILLLAESEKAAALDRRALRDAGYSQVRVMTSGIDAARLIAGMDKPLDGFYPDVAMCSRQLADMDGEQFCAIIRQHPQLLGFPVLLLLPNEDEVQQLRALGCGASALAARPYSVDFLKKKIQELARGVAGTRQLKEAAEKADTRAFDDALATYGVLLRTERQPEDFFKVGMKCLEERRWAIAIAAFERALRDAQIKAEAELGIAAAFKGKGDMARFKAWLARATETFIAAKRWNHARTAYARLLQHDPSAKNPFLAEAHRLIRQQLYDDAAQCLVQSLSLVSKMKAGDRIARVCMAADDPEEMFAVLEKTLEQETRGSHDYLGAEIRQSLDVMITQRRERQRQHQQEREWQLARSMGVLPEQREAEEAARAAKSALEAQEQAAAQKASQGSGIKAPRVGKPLQPAGNFGVPEDFADESVLAPLNLAGSADSCDESDDGYVDGEELFKKKTRLNELFSVVKLTWKLSRRSRKKS